MQLFLTHNQDAHRYPIIKLSDQSATILRFNFPAIRFPPAHTYLEETNFDDLQAHQPLSCQTNILMIQRSLRFNYNFTNKIQHALHTFTRDTNFDNLRAHQFLTTNHGTNSNQTLQRYTLPGQISILQIPARRIPL